MRFWDASAVMPLCIREAATVQARQLFGDDAQVSVWWATRLECVSAFARAVREGRLSSGAEIEARDRLRALLEGGTEVAPREDVRVRAERLLAVHPLRAADALQLGAALVWARERPLGMGFVCLDRRLRDAAHREGFEVLP